MVFRHVISIGTLTALLHTKHTIVHAPTIQILGHHRNAGTTRVSETSRQQLRRSIETDAYLIADLTLKCLPW